MKKAGENVTASLRRARNAAIRAGEGNEETASSILNWKMFKSHSEIRPRENRMQMGGGAIE